MFSWSQLLKPDPTLVLYLDCRGAFVVGLVQIYWKCYPLYPEDQENKFNQRGGSVKSDLERWHKSVHAITTDVHWCIYMSGHRCNVVRVLNSLLKALSLLRLHPPYTQSTFHASCAVESIKRNTWLESNACCPLEVTRTTFHNRH